MRFEYKYIVPIRQLESLRQDVLQFVTPDVYAAREANHEYTVRSIYFDTMRLKAYREKLDGIKIRKKLRIRSYNVRQKSSTAFLEIKTKIDQRGMKHRAGVCFEDIPLLFNATPLEEIRLRGRDQARSFDAARRFMFHIVRFSMKPVILVTYDREAYQGRFADTLRITFDKHLRYLAFPALSQLFQERDLRYVASRFFILEIKFDNGFAPWLQSVVKKHNLIRTSVSKYGSCLQASGMPGGMLANGMVETERSQAPWRSEVAA